MILWTSRASHTYILLILIFCSYLYFAHTEIACFGFFSLTSSRKIIALEMVQKEQLQIENLDFHPRNCSTDHKKKKVPTTSVRYRPICEQSWPRIARISFYQFLRCNTIPAFIRHLSTTNRGFDRNWSRRRNSAAFILGGSYWTKENLSVICSKAYSISVISSLRTLR